MDRQREKQGIVDHEGRGIRGGGIREPEERAARDLEGERTLDAAKLGVDEQFVLLRDGVEGDVQLPGKEAGRCQMH